jgi:hypothetical protein
MAASLGLVIRRPIYGSATKTAYTGTAGSTTVPPYTASVLLWCSTAAYVRVGGTATTGDLPLPANAPIIIPTDNTTGAPITVSAIQEVANGNLFCIAMAD